MNILMFTNTYLPHVGGVARSIHRFAVKLKEQGNHVRIVAPDFTNSVENPDVFRVPAIRNFNRSGFSVPLLSPGSVRPAVEGFIPDVVHSHHPFLLGNTALRYAAFFGVPIVFTHHTLYESYTHYIPGDSFLMKRFIVNLTASYCNHADTVIAPSSSLASMLLQRGVRSPVEVIPTGIDRDRFSGGDGTRFRRRYRIPENAFVVGHVGRLALEKNIEYLTLSLSHYLRANPEDHLIIAGVGPMEEYIHKVFDRHGLTSQLHMIGILNEDELPDAYSAMDVFAFASQSETQGLVLMEALSAGVPVVALDGPGVRDVVKDRVNGRLIQNTDIIEYVRSLLWVKSLGSEGRRSLQDTIGETVSEFTMDKSVSRLMDLYAELLEKYCPMPSRIRSHGRMLKMEARIADNNLMAFVHSITPTARELYSCDSDMPSDIELQTLLAQRSSIGASVLGYLISLFIRGQKVTWRTYTEGIGIIEDQIKIGEPGLVSFWHGEYMPLFALLEGMKGCIFASCSFRGEVIAEVCRRFGYECILIPHHAKQRAVEIMAKSILHYRIGAVAADGPRGPNRAFKLGSVQLASELGMSVIPVAVASRPKIKATKRWDRYEVPLPLSRVCMLVGNGVTVPVGLKDNELNTWSERLKNVLDQVDKGAAERLNVMRLKKGIPEGGSSRPQLTVIPGKRPS